MASAFPRSPRLLKGALVVVDPDTAQPTVIAFQYNPGTLTRKLEVQALAEGGPSSEVQRLTGAPIETIDLEAELDATDGLEGGDPDATSSGIHPQLAALELLVYPSSTDVLTASALADGGSIEIAPAEGPMTLFVWGKRRVLPVRITSFNITEEAFDINLNPIRAKVSLGLRVLSYNDLGSSTAGYSLFMAHQVVKETLASKAMSTSLDRIGGSDIDLG